MSYLTWKQWAPENFGHFTEEDEKYYEAELRGLIASESLKVLEIGYGNGAFAGWCKSRGLAWTGHDTDAQLTATALSRGYNAIESLDHALAPYDLIVCFDVLEHICLSELPQYLARLRLLLKTNGALIARIPSGDSPFVGSIAYGDITHRNLLGSSAYVQLANQTGFEVVKISSPALPILGLGLRKAFRRGALTLARLILYPLIRQCFYGGSSKVVLDSNMIVILIVPK